MSGGGDIGASFGRLFQIAADHEQPAMEVEQSLAYADTRWFGFWLRANGHYLFPSGAKDNIFAVANFGRNLIGVHIKLAFLGLLLGCMLIGFDLFAWQWADCWYSNCGCLHPAWISMRAWDAAAQLPIIWVFLLPLMLTVASLAVA